MRSVAIPIGVVGFAGAREQEKAKRAEPPITADKAKTREVETMVMGQFARLDSKLPVYRQYSRQNHPKKISPFLGNMALWLRLS